MCQKCTWNKFRWMEGGRCHPVSLSMIWIETYWGCCPIRLYSEDLFPILSPGVTFWRPSRCFLQNIHQTQIGKAYHTSSYCFFEVGLLGTEVKLQELSLSDRFSTGKKRPELGQIKWQEIKFVAEQTEVISSQWEFSSLRLGDFFNAILNYPFKRCGFLRLRKLWILEKEFFFNHSCLVYFKRSLEVAQNTKALAK